MGSYTDLSFLWKGFPTTNSLSIYKAIPALADATTVVYSYQTVTVPKFFLSNFFVGSTLTKSQIARHFQPHLGSLYIYNLRYLRFPQIFLGAYSASIPLEEFASLFIYISVMATQFVFSNLLGTVYRQVSLISMKLD